MFRSRSPFAAAAACAIECQEFEHTCDGGTVVYCFHGKRFRADCAAAGFHGCDLRGCVL